MNFNLFFGDLKDEAQARLLDVAGLNDPSEANWDLFPIDILEFYNDDDDDEEEYDEEEYDEEDYDEEDE